MGWVSFVGGGNLEFVLRLIEIWIVWAKKEVVAVVLVFFSARVAGSKAAAARNAAAGFGAG